MRELPLLAEWQRVTHRILAALDDALAGLALSPAEVNALACFAGREAVALRELVEATGQRPSTLTGVLDRLERGGLVRRIPNPEDRRSLQIVLTHSGRQTREAVDAAFAHVERRLPSSRRIRELLRNLDAIL